MLTLKVQLFTNFRGQAISGHAPQMHAAKGLGQPIWSVSRAASPRSDDHDNHGHRVPRSHLSLLQL